MASLVNLVLCYRMVQEDKRAQEALSFEEAKKEVQLRLDEISGVAGRHLMLLEAFAGKQSSCTVVGRWCFGNIGDARLLLQDLARAVRSVQERTAFSEEIQIALKVFEDRSGQLEKSERNLVCRLIGRFSQLREAAREGSVPLKSFQAYL